MDRKKRLRGLHIRLGAPYKRVALGRIRCFCLSQAARDVQQVQETTNSPLCANGLQAADYPTKEQQQGAKEQQQGTNRSSSFYSATNRFVIVLFRVNRFRTIRPFRLKGWGVSYNGKGRSVFVSFRKKGTITLYCLILYVTYTYVRTDVVRLLLYRMYHMYVHNKLYCGSLR